MNKMATNKRNAQTSEFFDWNYKSNQAAITKRREKKTTTTQKNYTIYTCFSNVYCYFFFLTTTPAACWKWIK